MIDVVALKLKSGKSLELTYDELEEIYNDLLSLKKSKLLFNYTPYNTTPQYDTSRDQVNIDNTWVKPAWQQTKIDLNTSWSENSEWVSHVYDNNTMNNSVEGC